MPYVIGQEIRVQGEFRSALTDALTDPTTLVFVIREPNGTETNYAYGTDAEIVKESAGLYHVDLTLTQSGGWHFRWEATGSVVTASEKYLAVEVSPFDLPVPPPSPFDNGKVAIAHNGRLAFIGGTLGQFLRWGTDGAVFASGSPSGGLMPPLDPDQDNYFSLGLHGDLIYVSPTDATSRLDLFTSTLKGLTPASGGGTSNFLRADGSWGVPPGILTPPTGGDDYKVAFGLTGNLSFATSVKLSTGGDALLFGATPATGGLLRVPNNVAIIGARNNINTADARLLILDASNQVIVGDSAFSGNLILDAASGFGHYLRVAGVAEYGFDSTQLTMNGNNLIMGAGFAQFGTNPATTGTLRLPQSSSLYARNSGNTADLPLLRMGAIANTLVLGGGTEGLVGVNIDTTSGSIKLRVANTDEYTFSSTGADFTNNFIQFGTNPAASGTIRFPHGSAGSIVGRNNANNADRSLLRWGITNTDELAIGNISSDTWVHALATVGLFINGVQEYTFGTAVADFKDNTLQFGTTPAGGSALIRVPNAVTVVGARNAANSADLDVLRVDNTDKIFVGDPTNTANVVLSVKTGGNAGVRINNTTLYSFDSGAMTCVGTAIVSPTYVQFGTNPALSGLLRVPNNSTILGGRNAANNADASLLSWGSSTTSTLTVGSNNTVTEVELRAASGGQHSLVIANGLEYLFTATTADFKDNRLQFGTNPASSGLVGVPHASNILFGRNGANTQNSPLIRWGNPSPLSGTDLLYFGSASGDSGKVANMRWGIDTGGGYQWEVNSSAIATLDAGAFSLPAGQYLSFGSAALSIPPATAGMVRMPNTATIYRRNAANTQDIRFVNMSDDLTLGDIFQGGSLYLDVPTGQSHSLRVNGTSKLSVDTNGLTTVALAAVTAQTTSSTASAGAAAALPNSPQGYIVVTINGTSRKIPYYPT